MSLTFDLKVLDSLFQYINKQGNGGALEIDSEKNLLIKTCFFVSISVSLNGGSVFLNIATVKFEDTCFDNSYSTKYGDNAAFGNAIYVNGFTYIQRCICHHSGPREGTGCDSTIFLNYGFNTEYLNASSNYGFGGPSSIASASGKVLDSVKFSTDVNSHTDFIYTASSAYTIYNSNIVNSTNVLYGIIWESQDNLITFDNCIFINMHPIFSSSDTSYIITNCIVNSQTNTIFTYTQNPTTFDFFFEIKPNKGCATLKKISFYIKLTYFLVIFIH